jgi:SAM-dependent methyltransferase
MLRSLRGRGATVLRSSKRRLRHRWSRTAPARANVGRRTAPVSHVYGFDRGTPIDRYYIEGFLQRFASFSGYTQGTLRGRVLEIGGRDYADRFAAGAQIDVLHENDANPEATIVGDITAPGTLPENTYDCIICTQTLPVIWDVPAALAEMHRGLKPGGVLLATVPGITKALLPDRDHWGDWWRFTGPSLRRLCAEAFGAEGVHVETYGNLLSATLFLHGYASDELTPAELDLRDPDFEVTIAVRATKAAAPAA